MTEPRWDDDILTIPFVARRTPLVAPTEGIFDSDLNDAGFNVKWSSHIIGALEVLNQRDSWYGTAEEQDTALQQIQALIELFSTVVG